MKDTPRTNDIIEQVKGFRTSSAIYSLEQFSRELERELTAVTEQRDRLLEQQEQWRLSSVCRELVEQRDRLAEALAKAGVGDYKADYFLGELTETGKLRSELTAARAELRIAKRDMSDGHAQWIMDCDIIQSLTEQRDRLADLTKQFIKILDITEESDSGRSFHPTNITSCRAGDLHKIGELVEALRRACRTTNPNEL